LDLVLFANSASFHDLFLGRNVGGSAGEMQMFENLTAEAEKRFVGAITWSRELDINLVIDSPGHLRHDEDAIAHVDGFINVMGDKKKMFSFRFARCARDRSTLFRSQEA
jgi:hypothetical protein